MNNRTIHAAMFGLLFGLACAGCSKSPSQPAVSVPADCQKFLDTYFDALKSKDIGKLQDLSSASYSFLVAAGGADMPANVADMAREDGKKIIADSYTKAFEKFGDFQSCSVISEKETTVATAAPDAPQILKAGTHTEVVCKAKFSKNSGAIQLNLFKEKSDSDYSVEGWRYEGHL